MAGGHTARAKPGGLITGTALHRLLTRAGQELDADVAIVDASTPPESAHGIDVALPDIPGRRPHVLRVTPHASASRGEADARLARLVAQLVGDELDERADRHADRWERVDRILAVLEAGDLPIVYQPIMDLYTGEIVGVEALSRFPQPPAQSPDRWFAEAAAVGLGPRLETMAVARAAHVLDKLPKPVYLSVNISPEAAVSEDVAALLARLPLERLVLEITEHAEVADYDALNRGLSRLRSHGLRLAVDDAGSGFASMRHVLRLAPDIIKLDTSLTHGIDNDSVLRALGFSLKSFAGAIEAQVIAEGIETEEELDALRFLGVAYGQGYFLRRPGPLPSRGWVGEPQHVLRPVASTVTPARTA